LFHCSPAQPTTNHDNRRRVVEANLFATATTPRRFKRKPWTNPIHPWEEIQSLDFWFL
jgi:hypothetical protein